MFQVVKREGHRVRYKNVDDNEKTVYECHIKYVRKCFLTDHALLSTLTAEQKDRLWGNIYYRTNHECGEKRMDSQHAMSSLDGAVDSATSVGVREMNDNEATQKASNDLCQAEAGTTQKEELKEKRDCREQGIMHFNFKDKQRDVQSQVEIIKDIERKPRDHPSQKETAPIETQPQRDRKYRGLRVNRERINYAKERRDGVPVRDER